MNSRTQRLRRMLAVMLLVGSIGATGTVLPFESSASASALPNPCPILASTHAATTIAMGKHVAIGKIVGVNTHYPPVRECEQKVGAVLVHLEVGTGTGGYGGITDIHISHPGGLGSQVTLVVAKNLGPNGGPYDLIFFKEGSLWISIWADGASPGALITVARQIYKILPGLVSPPRTTTTTVPTTTTTTTTVLTTTTTSG